MAFLYQVRTRNNFDPKSKEPFVVSRSKIDLFLECPRCFYIDQRLGIKRPDSFPFTLNNAVDALLKKEFDFYRKAKQPHPLVSKFGLDMVPFQHKDMETWRDALRGGIRYLHTPTNLMVRGGIDDAWVTPEGEVVIVDYKATSKSDPQAKMSLDADWQIGYKRQVEVYHWLFEHNDFKVYPTAYFVYANGKQDRDEFDARLDFDIEILPYKCDSSWVEPTLMKMKECLVGETPKQSEECQYCAYRLAAAKAALKK